MNLNQDEALFLLHSRATEQEKAEILIQIGDLWPEPNIAE